MRITSENYNRKVKNNDIPEMFMEHESQMELPVVFITTCGGNETHKIFHRYKWTPCIQFEKYSLWIVYVRNLFGFAIF